jgi:hypothetical protein
VRHFVALHVGRFFFKKNGILKFQDILGKKIKGVSNDKFYKRAKLQLKIPYNLGSVKITNMKI